MCLTLVNIHISFHIYYMYLLIGYSGAGSVLMDLVLFQYIISI